MDESVCAITGVSQELFFIDNQTRKNTEEAKNALFADIEKRLESGEAETLYRTRKLAILTKASTQPKGGE